MRQGAEEDFVVAETVGLLDHEEVAVSPRTWRAGTC